MSHASSPSADALIGWRAWGLAQGADGRWQLTSDRQGFHWQVENVAACEHGEMGEMEGCECGFNAWRSRELLAAAGQMAAPAVGSIYLSGRVDQYELGWRAQQATVTSIELSPDAPIGAELDLRERYGCAVARRVA
jgi:hypothetical protein